MLNTYPYTQVSVAHIIKEVSLHNKWRPLQKTKTGQN